MTNVLIFITLNRQDLEGYLKRTGDAPFMVRSVGCTIEEAIGFIARGEEVGPEPDGQKQAEDAIVSLVHTARRLHHYHLCEQEGIRSGKPHPSEWMDAVEKLGTALDFFKMVPDEG